MSVSNPQLPAPVEDGVLGRYRLRSRIASGGAGSVFTAEDAYTGTEVVVKFIDAREDALGGWVKEMRIALRLMHPHIVRCRSVGYDQELQAWALIYDYATGGSLRRALVQKNQDTIELAPEVLKHVASALHYAHQQNVVHRDVKPENVVATTEDGERRWKLTDFGDARHLLEGDSAESVVGSLTYMAPETFGGQTTRLSDIYSLGVVGLEMLEGMLPTRRAIRDFARQHWRSQGLRGVVADMVAPHPSDRYPHTQMLLHTLSDPASPHSWWASGDAWANRVGDRIRWRVDDVEGENSLPHFVRFVETDGQAPLISQARRLSALGRDRKTLYADERPFVAFAHHSEAQQIWLLRENQLCLVVGSTVAASAPWPDALPPPSGRARFATAPNRLAVYERGSRRAISVCMEDQQIAINSLESDLPVDWAHSRDEVLRLTVADDRITRELRLDGPAATTLRESPVPFGHLRYRADGTPWPVQPFDTTQFF